MPSLSDVANQVNNSLNDISANTHQTAITAGQIKNDTAAANVKLDAINTTLQNGFFAMGQGLFAIHEAQKVANSLLLANSAENHTIICWLANIADLLCRELRKMNIELELQARMQHDLQRLEAILELVHARETLEVERLAKIQAEMEACCEREPKPPEHCYEPCVLEPVEPYRPRGQDWNPPHRPND